MITAVVALVALALSGAGAVVYAIESRRLAERTIGQVEQELDEFAEFRRSSIDPATGRLFRDPGALVVAFLRNNVPHEGEILVAWYDDAARKAFPRDDPFVRSEAFAQSVRALLVENGSERVRVPGGGEAIVTVQGVQAGDETAALVILTYLDGDRAELAETMRTYAVVAVLALLLISAFGAWQSGRLLAPLRTLRETAEEIRDTDLSRRIPERGNDDLTALTRTVNGMLDRLESAFVGQRQFLDDAGHELKTPLTVLRGHLEVLDPADRAEVEQTRALLLDELDRTSRLVGELLLLAKASRPDFVELGPVSLERLIHTLVAKASGLGDRQWQLEGVVEEVVPLDEQRITQAVLQLADNAVKHTSAGDPIAIGSATDGSWVRIWVRDHGTGIPEEDRERVFERFGRSVVHPDDEGFGLGLSIVRAIAVAHGGTATYEDAAPGARIVIRVPREAAWPAS